MRSVSTILQKMKNEILRISWYNGLFFELCVYKPYCPYNLADTVYDGDKMNKFLIWLTNFNLIKNRHF